MKIFSLLLLLAYANNIFAQQIDSNNKTLIEQDIDPKITFLTTEELKALEKKEITIKHPIQYGIYSFLLVILDLLI